VADYNYTLTDRQKELLRKLVEYDRQGRLGQPFCFVAGGIRLNDGEVFRLEGDYFGDLYVLAEADLLVLRYDSKGNKRYSIKQAGYKAVDNNFAAPAWMETPLNIGSVGAIVLQMNGGNIQAVGVADNAELTQIVGDPTLLQSQLEDLTSQLLDQVRSVLSGADLIEYVQAIQEFKEQLAEEEPNSPLLKRLASKLAFLADIEGTISLVAKVWPYLYPLLLIATEKFGL
jgi:hypothetical protein